MSRAYLPESSKGDAPDEAEPVPGRVYVNSSTYEVAEGAAAEEPAANASRAEWENYARAQGASDEDLVDEDGKPLKRDLLREKYGTPSE